MSGHGRDYDVYQIVPPDGGEPVRHARVTTIADTLDDRHLLEKWQQRMVALGLAARDDLYALASTLSPDDKGKLNRVCSSAIEAARGSSRANLGTALHTLAERIDRGEKIIAPPMMKHDLAAYLETLNRYGIEIIPDYVERVCVCSALAEPVAGTVDRIVRYGDDWYICDLKTGASLDFSWRAIAIQLAVYSRASSLYDREEKAHEEVPPVRQDVGIVLHLPAGKSKCKPYLVDLERGWKAAKLAVEVRAWRKTSDLSEPLTMVDEKRAA